MVHPRRRKVPRPWLQVPRTPAVREDAGRHWPWPMPDPQWRKDPRLRLQDPCTPPAPSAWETISRNGQRSTPRWRKAPLGHRCLTHQRCLGTRKATRRGRRWPTHNGRRDRADGCRTLAPHWPQTTWGAISRIGQWHPPLKEDPAPTAAGASRDSGPGGTGGFPASEAGTTPHVEEAAAPMAAGGSPTTGPGKRKATRRSARWPTHNGRRDRANCCRTLAPHWPQTTWGGGHQPHRPMAHPAEGRPRACGSRGLARQRTRWNRGAPASEAGTTPPRGGSCRAGGCRRLAHHGTRVHGRDGGGRAKRSWPLN